MIQRKQTLFLFQLVFLGIALLFIPVCVAVTNNATINVGLVPLREASITSTAGHLTAIALNFIGLIIASVTIFLYRRRPLQVKLCYGLLVIWIILTLMTAFCPFIATTDTLISVSNTYYGPIIGAFGILASWLAARFIKKDIDLLKSADRIR